MGHSFPVNYSILFIFPHVTLSPPCPGEEQAGLLFFLLLSQSPTWAQPVADHLPQMQGHPPTPGAAWRNKITRSTITLFLPQRAPTRKELLSSPHSFTQVPCWTMFSASRGMEVEGDYLSVSWEGPRGSSSPGRWLGKKRKAKWTELRDPEGDYSKPLKPNKRTSVEVYLTGF